MQTATEKLIQDKALLINMGNAAYQWLLEQSEAIDKIIAGLIGELK